LNKSVQARKAEPAVTRCFLLATLAAILALPALAQPAPEAGKLSDDALRQLLAPIALYPDQVLTDILAAATYPAQIVEADRFRADPAHANLSGQALQDAAASEDWDQSVKDLLLFPQVLQNMDEDLRWTEQLGQAVIAQQADVMTAVQELRAKAELAGTLATGNNDLIATEGADIVIAPPSPQDVYLPAYQPHCVFGPDPDCNGGDSGIDWGAGFLVPYGFVQWGRIDWPHRRITLDTARREPHGGGFLVGGWRRQALRPAVVPPAYGFTPALSARLRTQPVARAVPRVAPPHVAVRGHR
jgi:hypothetical protein